MVERVSPVTGERNVLDLDITDEEIKAYENGALIQNAFPRLTASQREFIISGILDDEEWNSIMPPDDDEEDVTYQTVNSTVVEKHDVLPLSMDCPMCEGGHAKLLLTPAVYKEKSYDFYSYKCGSCHNAFTSEASDEISLAAAKAAGL